MNKYVKNILKYAYNCLKSSIRKREYLDLRQLLKGEDFCPINNVSPVSIRNITFVVPAIVAHMGGHTSILRIVSALYDEGYNVSIVAYSDQTVAEMKKNAETNLHGIKCNYFSKETLYSINSDVVVATSWSSVYYAKKINGFKIYFIQDYEPYFYAYGDYYFLAKKTYDFGFLMISLGKWNKDQIVINNSNCNPSDIFTIDFPYEKKEYKVVERNFAMYARKRKLKIVAYIKEDDKRLPLMSQVILTHVKNRFSELGIDVEIQYFGMNKNFNVMGGKNLGKLGKSELNNLYAGADFGFVASMTNISLVPYEMIATRLPIIEMIDGSFPAFFGNESAILCDLNGDKLFNEIRRCCLNPEVLIKMVSNAENYINKFCWEKTCKQFVDIVNNITK